MIVFYPLRRKKLSYDYRFIEHLATLIHARATRCVRVEYTELIGHLDQQDRVD